MGFSLGTLVTSHSLGRPKLGRNVDASKLLIAKLALLLCTNSAGMEGREGREEGREERREELQSSVSMAALSMPWLPLRVLALPDGVPG
jgi:hypothetical protein